MRRPSNAKLMTPEEKVQYLLRNGHLFKEHFVKKPKFKDGKIDKAALAITKDSFMFKNGKIRKKHMDSFRYIDNILKSELMIDDSKLKTSEKKNSRKTPKTSEKKNINTTNNNDVDLSNHNINEVGSNELIPVPTNSKGQETKKLMKNCAKSSPKSKKSDDSPNTPKFECDQCGKVFNNKSAISKHMTGHLNVKPHKCPHCTKKFHYATSMQEHITTQHNEYEEALGTYICDICDHTCNSKEGFDMHLSTHINKPDSFKCLYCDETYNQYFMLTQHEKKHLVRGRHQCTICRVTFRRREVLSDHLKTHLKIKEFICQYCGKEFLRLNSMHRHVLVCHVGVRIQCPVCKKSLKGHLTEHMRTHEKKRPHKCPDCGQRFTQSTQLNVHRRSHTGARPYPCRICNRNFSHSNALMLHIRRHTGEKPFPCAMCPITFSQLPHMKAHMRNIHGKENAYRCTKCNMFFKLKADLERHSKNCTVGDRELSFEEKIEASVKVEEVEVVESAMSLSRMRYLLALLLTMIASKEKLKYLGFNKRLIDDLLIESLEAMDLVPCKDESLVPIKRLKTNIAMLLHGTVPKEQMDKLIFENKSTEEILELLTGEEKKEI